MRRVVKAGLITAMSTALIVGIAPAQAAEVPTRSPAGREISRHTGMDVKCADVVMVTVRGSGDRYEPRDRANAIDNASPGGSSVVKQKFTHFADDVYRALQARGKTLQVVDAYNFGKTKYPAAPIPPDLGDALAAQGDGAGAWSAYLAGLPGFVATGMYREYRDSFRDGIKVVEGYTNKVLVTCPNSKVLLTGHSQGGGIVSSVLAGNSDGSGTFDPSRVFGVAWADSGFRGDDEPSNWSGVLPTSDGTFAGDGAYIPTRDFGYRANINGTSTIAPDWMPFDWGYPFELRAPLTPTETGGSRLISICHGVDFVCQANPWNFKKYGFARTHSWYGGFEVGQVSGAREAATLRESLIASRRIVSEMFGRTGPEQIQDLKPQDFLFVIDRTGSMRGHIADFDKDIRSSIESLRARYGDRVRFGFVGYGDTDMKFKGTDDSYIFEMIQQPTTDVSAINAALLRLTDKSYITGNGAESPEAMYAGIRRAMDAQWTAGATRNIVVMTDAGNRWSTKNDETAEALANRLTNAQTRLWGKVYGGSKDAAADIWDVINGMTMANPGALLENRRNAGRYARSGSLLHGRNLNLEELIVATDAPSPIADAGGPYTVYVGQRGNLTLSGFGSYDPEGRIVRYQWDTDEDGYWECDSPTNPTWSLVTLNFTGERKVRLRVTNDLGVATENATTLTAVVAPDGQTTLPAAPTAPTATPMPGLVKLEIAPAAAPVIGWLVQKYDPATGAYQDIALVGSKPDGVTPDLDEPLLVPLETTTTGRIVVANDLGESAPTDFQMSPLPKLKEKKKPSTPTIKPGKKRYMVSGKDNKALLGTYWEYGTLTKKQAKKAKSITRRVMKNFQPVPGAVGFEFTGSPDDKKQLFNLKRPKVSKKLVVCLKAVSVDWAGNVSKTITRCDP